MDTIKNKAYMSKKNEAKPLRQPAVICSACGAENSIRWEKKEISRPGYNPRRVIENNIRRDLWNSFQSETRYPFSYDGADEDQWGDCDFGIHE